MPTPFVVIVDAPPAAANGAATEPGAIADALARNVEMSNQVWCEVFGHHDFDSFAHKMLATLQFQKYRRTRVVLVLDREPHGLGTSAEGMPLVLPETDLGAARVLGSSQARLEFHDNPHLVDEELARAWGCTTISGFSTHVGVPPTDLVMPAEGPFGVGRDDAATRFAQARDYHLAQGERHSVQPLPEDPATMGRPQVANGYALQAWHGPIDPALAQDMARLITIFESSVPMGELDYNPQVVTAERVMDGSREMHRHDDSLTVAVRHLASDSLVGYTQLIATPELPQAVWQGITVVVPDHRGHALGHAIKLAAVHEARRCWPDAQRVHTWNAGENDHMWAINQALGYQTAGVAGAWQKKLTDAPSQASN